MITRRSGTQFDMKNECGVVYVPLTDNYQLKSKSQSTGSSGGSGGGSGGSAAAGSGSAAAPASTKK